MVLFVFLVEYGESLGLYDDYCLLCVVYCIFEEFVVGFVIVCKRVVLFLLGV